MQNRNGNYDADLPIAGRDSIGPSRLHEDDPELEREYRMMAELLIDIYLWKREQRRNLPQDQVDRPH